MEEGGCRAHRLTGLGPVLDFANFIKQMRIKDKDAYWLDTRMDDGGTCRYGVGGGQPVICELVAQ
ncbi:hypothetical protein AB0D49_38140 [Streptomyces sp. NPDC048290]|uniref:hypothetical protein n=1 Tax=Streptomyces sp. NPDC048290 TaxID=3155811 RepID=UPI0034397258